LHGDSQEPRSLIGRRGLYEDGYKEAADTLVDSVQGGQQQHWILYPIIFLYRHWLELTLKGLITYAHHTKQHWQPGEREKKLKDLASYHDLGALWGELKSFLAGVRLDLSLDTTIAFDFLVKEFAAYDERGQAFRYPVNTRDVQTLQQPDVIDLPNLKFTVAAMSNYLGVVHEAIAQHLDPDI